MHTASSADASNGPDSASRPADETDDDGMELGYEAALPFLNSQPGDLDLLFSPQHEAPTHER
jgi:hypothetical protein